MNKDIFRSIVTPYTMTSKQRIDALYDSLEYIRNAAIVGDYVECGVWRGGNILGIISYLDFHAITDSNVWLYDTFSGMTAPESVDVDLNNRKAENILNEVLCAASIEDVRSVLSSSKYPQEKVKYVIGDICQTLLEKDNIPEKISLLRLDTDWYSSTKIELNVLWDKLSTGAPCIIDDYGHWQGCKKAVDEFLENLPIQYELEKIDYTCVRLIKK